MRSNIKHSYEVDLLPDEYEDYDYIFFRLEAQKFPKGTVEFQVSNSSLTEKKYVGVIPHGIWYLDPENYRGMTLPCPFSITKLEGELEELEYDEDDCLIIAKSIELICNDFLGVSIVEEVQDLPF